jgi:hypothetical protein
MSAKPHEIQRNFILIEDILPWPVRRACGRDAEQFRTGPKIGRDYVSADKSSAINGTERWQRSTLHRI